MPDDFYDLLGVSEDASEAEIRRAFREKARVYHPDVNDDERASAQFKTLREAYETLRDPKERSDYDRMGHRAYVDERLGGLPTSVVDAGRTSSSSSSSSSARWNDSGSSGSTSAGSGSRSSRSAPGSGSGSASTSSRSSTARSGGESSSRSTSASSATSTSTSSGRSTASARTGAASGRRSAGSQTVGGTGARSPPSAAGSSTPVPLRNAWLTVLFAGLVYAAGLGWYLRSNAAAVRRVADVVRTDPGAVLAGSYGLAGPGALVRGLVADLLVAPAPTPDLLLPAGAVLLPTALLVTVYRFGSGAAWLYVFGALAPGVVLVAGPFLPVPTLAVVAVGVVGLPAVATVAFLGDVGLVLYGG